MRILRVVDDKYQITTSDDRLSEHLENWYSYKNKEWSSNCGELPVDTPGIKFLEQDPWRKGLRIKEEFEIPKQSRV